MIIGITWTFTLLAIIAIVLRLYTRHKLTRSLGWEDWFMLIAGILQLVTQCFFQVSYGYGLGKHDKDIQPPENLIQVMKYNFISGPTAILVSITARISIAILLVRLFGVRVWFKWFMIIFTTLQSVVGVAEIIIILAQANPIEGLWNPSLPGVTYWDPRVYYYTGYFMQSLYTFSDLAYVLFPTVFIWKLNMPLRRKVGLILLMAASLFTVSMSILRIVGMTTVANPGTSNEDYQYNSSIAVLWSGLEQSCVILMGCIPTLRGTAKLVKPVFSSIGSTLSALLKRSSNSYGANTYYDLDKSAQETSRAVESQEGAIPTASLPQDRRKLNSGRAAAYSSNEF